MYKRKIGTSTVNIINSSIVEDIADVFLGFANTLDSAFTPYCHYRNYKDHENFHVVYGANLQDFQPEVASKLNLLKNYVRVSVDCQIIHWKSKGTVCFTMTNSFNGSLNSTVNQINKIIFPQDNPDSIKSYEQICDIETDRVNAKETFRQLFNENIDSMKKKITKLIQYTYGILLENALDSVAIIEKLENCAKQHFPRAKVRCDNPNDLKPVYKVRLHIDMEPKDSDGDYEHVEGITWEKNYNTWQMSDLIFDNLTRGIMDTLGIKYRWLEVSVDDMIKITDIVLHCLKNTLSIVGAAVTKMPVITYAKDD